MLTQKQASVLNRPDQTVVDTRLARRPYEVDGTDAGRGLCSFIYEAYCSVSNAGPREDRNDIVQLYYTTDVALQRMGSRLEGEGPAGHMGGFACPMGGPANPMGGQRARASYGGRADGGRRAGRCAAATAPTAWRRVRRPTPLEATTAAMDGRPHGLHLRVPRIK